MKKVSNIFFWAMSALCTLIGIALTVGGIAYIIHQIKEFI